MPSLMAHYLFGEEVLKELDFEKKEQAALEKMRAFFDWGTFGPDSLFFVPKLWNNLKDNPLRKIGSRMHDEGAAAIFTAMRDYAEKSEHSEELKAYLYGFLCHIALDSAVHPLVYSVVDFWKKSDEEEQTPEFELHLKAEADMETVTLRWLKDGVIPNEYKLWTKLSLDKEIVGEIARMYAQAIKIVYGESFDAKQVESAIKGTYGIIKKSHDSTGFKKNFIHAMESLLGKPHYASSFIIPMAEDVERDYLNVQQAEWTNIFTGQPCENDYFELFEKAKKAAVNLIGNYGLQQKNISLRTGKADD